MRAPAIKVAVRHEDGRASLYHIQHPEIQTADLAITLTRDNIPDAVTVLASVPNDEEIAA